MIDHQEIKKKFVQQQSQLNLKQLSDDLVIDKVYGNRCLVKTVKPHTYMDDVEKQTGLYLPTKEEHTPRPATGIVVMVGDKWEDADLKHGDMVFFSKFAGADFIISEQDYRVLDYKEILCRVIPKDGITVND